MAKIRIGIGSDFRLKDQKLGLGENNPQERLDVAGVAKGKDLKVTGTSSLTAYEGFLRADHQIAENTTLSFDQGPSASLSGEIIVGTGQTVTVSEIRSIGDNLTKNSTFDNTNSSRVSEWTDASVGTGTISEGSGYATLNRTDGNNTGRIAQGMGMVPGSRYVINFEIVSGSTSGVQLRQWNSTGGISDVSSTTHNFFIAQGARTEELIVDCEEGRDGWLLIPIDGTSTFCRIDNFTVKEIKGDTTNTNRAGGSEIECLKAYNTFTPPSGGTNERPYAPKPGELYYNYDFKTIEFFDGNGWRQVDNTNRSGRAVFFGGYLGATGSTRTASMDLINIPTLGNSINFGNLESARTDTQGCSDGTRGLCAGGYHPARLTDTEYVTLASAGNSIQFGDLAQARNAFGGCSSSTRGLFAGGATPNAGAPSELQIDYFQISTLGTALDFGDSATSRAGLSGGIPSSTRAVWGAGTNRVGNPSTVTAVTMMDYSTFASKGNAVEFGNEILSRTTGNGCSSGTRGVFAGGYGSGALYSSPTSEEMGRKMSYITIASTGNAIEFGELSETRSYIGSNSTSTRGIWTGGSNYPTHYDSIEYVQFSSLGNALDFGNLHSTRGYMTGSASDSHGGLGGF